MDSFRKQEMNSWFQAEKDACEWDEFELQMKLSNEMSLRRKKRLRNEVQMSYKCDNRNCKWCNWGLCHQLIMKWVICVNFNQISENFQWWWWSDWWK
jgi:hypothetical protein